MGLKGILLAGGTGSRLAPLTRFENKHSLPVFNRRMIELPLKTLIDAGVRDVCIVCGGQWPGSFIELLKSGVDHDLDSLFFTYQEGNGGILDALACAEPFVKDDDCLVVLGDNYFEKRLDSFVKDWQGSDDQAAIFVQPTTTPQYLGIAELDPDNNILLSAVEKPKKLKSGNAILGAYLFDEKVWELISDIKPSKRGEREITDLLNAYASKGFHVKAYSYEGYWSDMGTFKSWTEVSQKLSEGKCS